MGKEKIELLVPGTKVFAISRYNNREGKETCYVSIFEAIVKTAYVDYNKNTYQREIDYWLSTPDGKEWGSEISGEEVSEDFNELVEKMKQEWIPKSNSFE